MQCVSGPEQTASDSAANLASWPSDWGGGWRPCAYVPWASRVLVLPPSSHASYRPLAVCRRRSASWPVCVGTLISAGWLYNLLGPDYYWVKVGGIILFLSRFCILEVVVWSVLMNNTWICAVMRQVKILCYLHINPQTLMSLSVEFSRFYCLSRILDDGVNMNNRRR